MKISINLAVVLALIGYVQVVGAQTIRTVPGQFTSIQAAINASASGDTILVSPGTYFGSIDTGTKQLILRATDGPERTILDAMLLSRVVTMAAPCTIEGFTIRNGKAPNGTFSFANINGGSGGGIRIVEAATTASSLPFIVRGCVISNCTTGNGGSSTVSGYPWPVTTGGNGGNGGGIFAQTVSRLIIDRCTVSGCAVGTGVYVTQGTSGRHGQGAGIYVTPSLTYPGEIVNTLVTANVIPTPPALVAYSPNDGAGITVGPPPTGLSPQPISIRSSTIVANTGNPGRIGGIASATTAISIENSIVAFNSGLQIGETFSTPTLFPTPLNFASFASSVTNCCVFPGGAPDSSNIGTDPLFVAGSDYRLQAASPCIDTGASTASNSAVDLAGAPREFGSSIDMGACEWIPRLAGTNEAFTLGSSVDGIGYPLVGMKVLPAGSTLILRYAPTTATFTDAIAGLALEVFASGVPPIASNPLFPELHINASSSILIDGPIFLPSNGTEIRNVVPPNLAGFTARVQAFALKPAALNGILALTDAHDLILQ